MEKVNFVAIDFETATAEMPCQLGIVVVRSGKIAEEKEFLIKPPGNKYDQHCIDVHHITPDKTENCSEFGDLWDEIKRYLEHEVVVAHNVDFDSNVLYRACEYYSKEMPRVLSYICTMKIYENRRLNEVAAALNIELDNHHDGLSDARACALAFIEYLKGVEPSELVYPKIPKKKRTLSAEQLEKKKLSKEALVQDLDQVVNDTTVFYNKKVVITGVFSAFPYREELAMKLKKLGADVNTSISARTDIVCMGSGAGPKKMEQIEQLRQKGIDIMTLSEDDLIEIFDPLFNE